MSKGSNAVRIEIREAYTAVVCGMPYTYIEGALPRIGARYMRYLSKRFSASVIDRNRPRIAKSFTTTAWAIHAALLEDAQRQMRAQPEVQP